MPDIKLTSITENTTPIGVDLMYMVDDLSGTPTEKRVTWKNLLQNIDVSVFIGDTANTKMTLGLTINQAGNDDELFAGKSSDVLHAMTGETEADTFFTLAKPQGLSGGAQLVGYKDADGTQSRAMEILGVLGEAASTGKTTGSLGVINMEAYVTDGGTGKAALAANGNVLTLRTGATTIWILDEDGDIFYGGSDDGTITDEYDDVGWLLTGFRAVVSPKGSPARGLFHGAIKSAERDLVRVGVLSAPISEGGLVSHKGLTGVMIDGMRQLYGRIGELENEVALLRTS